jgi:hypothetical protein
MPYTGPAAQFSAAGLAEKAYMQMINDQGGINGRKINLISVDDGYLPWRTGNETRKLIEVEQVAFTFGSIGTPTQLLVSKYLNERKIPQLSIDSGAYRWGDYKATPYTIGGVRPSYRLGARLYTRHILQQDRTAKICRAPRKIGATHPTPQNCPQMIPLRSRSDSLTFTPRPHAIGIENNFSRYPVSFMRTMISVATIRPACATCWATNTRRL